MLGSITGSFKPPQYYQPYDDGFTQRRMNQAMANRLDFSSAKPFAGPGISVGAGQIQQANNAVGQSQAQAAGQASQFPLMHHGVNDTMGLNAEMGAAQEFAGLGGLLTSLAGMNIQRQNRFINPILGSIAGLQNSAIGGLLGGLLG